MTGPPFIGEKKKNKTPEFYRWLTKALTRGKLVSFLSFSEASL